MKIKKKSFSIENNINKKYYKNNLFLRDKVKLNKVVRNICNNLDNKKDTFHILSKKFILNFDKSDLTKFKKYKLIVVIGMGGSILGANAIFFKFSEIRFIKI